LGQQPSAQNPCAVKNPCAAAAKIAPTLITRPANTKLGAGDRPELIICRSTNHSASRPAWGGVPSYVEIDYRTFRLSLTALPSNEILFDPEYLAKRGK